MNALFLLQTADPLLGMILPFALIFVIFYFFIIRPQNKKQKETKKMISELKKGDKIVTIGGIHGVVSSTKEHSVIVKIDDSAKIEFTRSAISTVLTDAVEKPAAKKDAIAEKPARANRWKKGAEAAGSEETTSDENTK